MVTAATPPPPPPPLLAEVVSDAVAGSDDPPELFATIWNLYVVPDDKPLRVAVDAGAVIVLVIGEPPPIGVAVTVYVVTVGLTGTVGGVNETVALDEVLDVTERFVGAAGMLVFAVTSNVFV